MKKSTLNIVTELRKKLLEFPAIVNDLERKDPSFLENLFKWMKKSEEIFITYNISEVSELSGLRSKIISPRFSDNKSISVRKTQLKIAAEVLYDLQKTVLKVLNPLEIKIEESRILIRQLLLIVSQTHEIKYNSALPFDDFVNNIWQFITSNEQLKAGAIKLKISLIMSDIQMLIAEEINLEDFETE